MRAAQAIPEAVFAESLVEFFAPVRRHFEDPSCSEVLINGHDDIWFERKGKLERSSARFSSPEALEAAVRNVAQYVGKTISPTRPILEGRLPDGSRVSAILPPCSRGGITVAIRRFSKEKLTMSTLVECGAMTADANEFLRSCVLEKKNILIGGGTGSGKTSLLNALSGYIPGDERVVVIEDATELQVQQPHVVYLEARPPGPRGDGEVSVRELLRATLRLRPDRIVLGEIRGGEAIDLVQAMTSGHGGCMATLHATHPQDSLHRIETMALMSDVALPLEALRAQIGSAVEMLVQVSRRNDGSRRVMQIAECRGYTVAGGYELVERFCFDARRGQLERVEELS